MYRNDKVIFLQLQKTECTHITRVPLEYVGGGEIKKHSQLIINPEDRTIFGSIRNPWDWYMSLWSYGCMEKGAVRGRAIIPRRYAIFRSFVNGGVKTYQMAV